METVPHKNSSDFADSWIEYARSDAGDTRWLDNEWVVGAAIEWARARPTDLLEAIVLICRQNLTVREIERLGCGPLEEFVSLNYDLEKEDIWRHATYLDNFRSALTYVSPEPSFEGDFDNRMNALTKH